MEDSQCVLHNGAGFQRVLELICMYYIACILEYKWAHANQDFGSDQNSRLRNWYLKHSTRILLGSPRVASI